ncbi:MAG TPA: trypsin-like peptidase domain-containing protein [Methylomirabilota bacterium]|nr:trypsin-like peptidase domain-containing protein [Methylomirabilota bacterium]
MRLNSLLTAVVLAFAPLQSFGAEPAANSAADPRRDATVIAVEKVMPTVVNIATKTVVERPVWIRNWFGWHYGGVQAGPPQYSAGSGVIVDEEGYVLSNVHVVEGATEIWVKLHDGSMLQADLVAGAKNTDVAVLKLKGKPGQKFQAAQLAAENDLLLGETVITLGNPFGLGGSVSRGILSSKSRRERVEGSLEIADWLQTDAAINPGNSGGPLINLRGEVIGLNVAVYREGQGIGFAIPIKRVLEAFSELFTPEALRSLWLGATFESQTNSYAVKAVERDSPAEKAGLKPGDVVTRVQGQAPRSLIELHRLLLPRGNSRDLELAVRRGNSERPIKVRLIPESAYFTANYLQERIGVTVQPLTAADAQRLGLGALEGLVVTAVEANSPASDAGLQRGYILSKIDELPIADVVAAGRAVHNRKAGELVKVLATSPRSMRSGLFELVLR